MLNLWLLEPYSQLSSVQSQRWGASLGVLGSPILVSEYTLLRKISHSRKSQPLRLAKDLRFDVVSDILAHSTKSSTSYYSLDLKHIQRASAQYLLVAQCLCFDLGQDNSNS